jgi:hypothetical protein
VALLVLLVACGASSHWLDDEVGIDAGDRPAQDGSPAADSGASSVDASADAACPPYPDGVTVAAGGDQLPNLAFAGGAPDEGIDGEIRTMDFWCWAHRADRPATVLLFAADGPAAHMFLCLDVLAEWDRDLRDRGLVIWGVQFGVTEDQARSFWLDQLAQTHPWAADPELVTAEWVDRDGDGLIGTPAYVVVDLSTMRIVATQDGCSGDGSTKYPLFEPYLRAE